MASTTLEKTEITSGANTTCVENLKGMTLEEVLSIAEKQIDFPKGSSKVFVEGKEVKGNPKGTTVNPGQSVEVRGPAGQFG